MRVLNTGSDVEEAVADALVSTCKHLPLIKFFKKLMSSYMITLNM